MAARNIKKEGIYGQHYCYRLNDIYFSPAEFAMAFIGIRKKQELRKILNTEVNNVREGKYSRDDIPLFYDAVMNVKPNNKTFNLEDMVLLAAKQYGTAKYIKRSTILYSGSKGNKGSSSVRDTISIRTDTREKRTAKHPSIDVKLSNPYVRINNNRYVLDDFLEFSFSGGSAHVQNNLRRRSFLSKRIPHENSVLEGISSVVKSMLKEKNNYSISVNDFKEDFSKDIFIVDYNVSCALSFLAKDKRERTRLIKGPYNIAADVATDVIMPFDFENKPVYAFEAFMMRHPAKGTPASLLDTDKYLMQKGVESEQFRQLFRSRKITKEIFYNTKHFPKNSYMWAIVGALTEHFYEKGRRFSGFTLEFENTPYETVAIAFKNTVRTNPNYSVRIIYDGNIGPYILYKRLMYNKNRKLLLDEDITSMNVPLGLKVHPFKIVNWAKDRSRNILLDGKTWIEKDSKSGLYALCSMYEINEANLERATAILANNRITADKQGRKINPFYLRGLYIEKIQSKL